MRATHPIEPLRIRPLESRVRRKLQARFGEGRMEKDAVGYPRGQKNSDIRRTSPAAYSTAAGFRAPPTASEPGDDSRRSTPRREPFVAWLVGGWSGVLAL